MCRRANDDLTQTSGQPTSDSSNPVDGLAQASLLSRLTFGWVYPLLALGRSRPLTETDLPQTPDPEQSIVLYEALEARWAHELQRSPSAPSFARALILDSLPTLLPAALIAVLESAMQITQAVCLGLHHVSNPQSNTSLALTLTLTLALALALALALTLTLTLALTLAGRLGGIRAAGHARALEEARLEGCQRAQPAALHRGAWLQILGRVRAGYEVPGGCQADQVRPPQPQV